jgi:hypothetical protein
MAIGKDLKKIVMVTTTASMIFIAIIAFFNEKTNIAYNYFLQHMKQNPNDKP